MVVVMMMKMMKGPAVSKCIACASSHALETTPHTSKGPCFCGTDAGESISMQKSQKMSTYGKCREPSGAGRSGKLGHSGGLQKV